MSEKSDLLNALLSLAMIVEARDPYTGGHLWRVSQFAKLLAQQAGGSRREVALCEIGGFLHDLGKVGVPDAILNKPDQLSADEYAVIKTHPAVGGKLLASHPLAGLAYDAVVGHHERPDGHGYPAGLAGESVPRIARIVSIADAFDAMTSTRPYRHGMRVEKALAIIRSERGSQFDDGLAQHFLAISDSAELVHIIGHSEPGLPLLYCPSCRAPMAMRRAQHPGDYLYCRACGGESRLTQDADGVALEMTGQRGDAAALAPDSDPDLIGAMVEDIAPHVL